MLNLKPVPASRARIPRYGKPYFLKTYQNWRNEADNLIDAFDGEPITRPVQAEVIFAIPRAKTSKLIVPIGDGDNYEKAIYDFLQRKGFVEDDKWITSACWKKRFTPYGTIGYTYVILKEETDDIDLT